MKKEAPMSFRRMLILWVLLPCFLVGCGSSQPIERLRRSLESYPEYSIVLQDMYSQGLFFQDYFHRYRLIYLPATQQTQKDGTPNLQQALTDWIRVDQSTFEHFKPYLGMVILSKEKNGTINDVPHPVDFKYVGDSRFGQWKTDDQGKRSWSWLATALILSEVVDAIGDAQRKGHYPIDYGDYQDYRRSTQQRTPYYGKKNEAGRPQFGTQGTVTQERNTGFFERQQARMADRKATFSQKVESRMGRTRVSGFTPRSSSRLKR